MNTHARACTRTAAATRARVAFGFRKSPKKRTTSSLYTEGEVSESLTVKKPKVEDVNALRRGVHDIAKNRGVGHEFFSGKSTLQGEKLDKKNRDDESSSGGEDAPKSLGKPKSS